MNTIKQITTAVVFSISSFLLVQESTAQDARFSQPYVSLLQFNPAAMGQNTDLKFNIHYRNQWGAINKGYNTGSFTALYPLYLKGGKNKLDIGINAMNDKAGAYNNMNMNLAVGYNVQLSESGFLSVSLLGGYVQKGLATSNLSFDEQYVLGSYNAANASNETILNKKVGYADVGGGLMWYYAPPKAEFAKLNAYVGVSAYHLNKPNQSLVSGTSPLAPRYSFQGGVKILGSKQMDFTPNVIFNSQGPAYNYAAGMLMDYNFNDKMKLTVGTWYRTGDAVPFLLGFSMKTFAINYSYDVVTSPISSRISGLNAHEISLILKFNQSEKKGAGDRSSSF